jgi:hypothetical protein
MIHFSDTTDPLLKLISFGIKQFFLHDASADAFGVVYLYFYSQYDIDYLSTFENTGIIEVDNKLYSKVIQKPHEPSTRIVVELVDDITIRRQVVDLTKHLCIRQKYDLTKERCVYHYLETLVKENKDDEMFLKNYLADKSLEKILEEKHFHTVLSHTPPVNM